MSKSRDANLPLSPETLDRLRAESRPIDLAEFLEDDADVAAYLEEALATRDSAYFAHALGVVAKARGMTEIARTAGVSRESLYKSLSGKGAPSFETLAKVLDALGLKLTIAPGKAELA